ncbi:peptidoglycan-binding domain-containing protein [Streptomyces sp. B22F1]|uniref:peptidoglycan-binding domain-containing protein n=1 Tax=Streptomyces sp. B22F1 TaxID=3153566 RepID=UPI00325E5D6E
MPARGDLRGPGVPASRGERRRLWERCGAHYRVLFDLRPPAFGGHPDPEARSRPEIRRGSTAVRHAQCLLRNGAGYVNVEIDGIFGRITETATKDAQSRCGAAVDGIIGPDPWRCLHAFNR